VERVELFSRIVEEGSFCVLDKEDIEQTVHSIFAESEDDFDLSQHLREMYGGYLKGDVMNFVSCLEYREEAQEDSTQEIENTDQENSDVVIEIDLATVRKLGTMAGFVLAAGFGAIIGKRFLK
jgi:hypothetical protein